MRVTWPRQLTPAHLCRIMSNQKNPLLALQFFNESKNRYANYLHNGFVYDTLINILGASGHIAKMKEIIGVMKEDSCECKDSTFANAIKFYADAGYLDESISLFRNLPKFNCVNWTDSFSTLLQILARDDRLETFYHIFLECSSCCEVKSWTVSLNLLIGSLCQRNRSDLALHVLQEMIHNCLSPDRETYLILMTGLCGEGRLDEAIYLLYSMFWKISRKGSGEDIVVYRILLNALCDNGRVSEAITVLEKVLRKGLKAPKRFRKFYDLNQIDDCGDIQQVKSRITQALICRGVPSMSSYNALSIILWQAGEITLGNHVLDEMLKKGFTPSYSIYEAKMAALCRSGRIDEAKMLVDKELLGGNCFSSVNIYNILMKSLCHRRESMAAVEYLGKMATKMGCKPSVETYQILANGLCHEGHFAEASQVIGKMLSKLHRPDTHVLTKLVKGLCVLGRRFEAVSLLEEIIGMCGVPDYNLWTALVTCSCFNITETPCSRMFDLLSRYSP